MTNGEVRCFASAVEALLVEGECPTKRELEVAYLLVAEGRTYAEAGEVMYLSRRSVDTYWGRFVEHLDLSARQARHDLLAEYGRLQGREQVGART